MEWFNLFGLLFVAIIMIPNIIYGIKCKEGFENKWSNKTVELLEQVGRFGCIGFMILNIPGTYFGWWSGDAFVAYLIVNAVLIVAYCVIWAVCFRSNSIFRALALSVLPSVVFLLSGVLSRSVLLTAAALVFAPCHILISYKNV